MNSYMSLVLLSVCFFGLFISLNAAPAHISDIDEDEPLEKSPPNGQMVLFRSQSTSLKDVEAIREEDEPSPPHRPNLLSRSQSCAVRNTSTDDSLASKEEGDTSEKKTQQKNKSILNRSLSKLTKMMSSNSSSVTSGEGKTLEKTPSCISTTFMPQSIINLKKNLTFNAPVMETAVKQLKRSLSTSSKPKQSLPRAVSNLKSNAFQNNVVPGVRENGIFSPCMPSKLDRAVTNVAIEARKLILEDKPEEGRKILFEIIKSRMVKEYHSKFENFRNIPEDYYHEEINELINQFVNDVNEGK